MMDIFIEAETEQDALRELAEFHLTEEELESGSFIKIGNDYWLFKRVKKEEKEKED